MIRNRENNTKPLQTLSDLTYLTRTYDGVDDDDEEEEDRDSSAPNHGPPLKDHGLSAAHSNYLRSLPNRS